MLSSGRSSTGSRAGRKRLQRHHALVGISVALVVAATIVAVGSKAGNGPGASATQLPPGHPSVSPSSGPSQISGVPDPSRMAAAIAKLERAHRRSPRDVTVLLDLGNDYYIAQRYRDAGKAFREALGLRPKDVAAQIRLAMVWHAQGLTAKAISTLQIVLKEAPSSQDAHYSLAILYFSEDQVTKARDQWAAAARIDPRSTIGLRSQSFVDLLDGKESVPPAAPRTASTPQGGFGSQSQGEHPARGD